MPVARGDRGCSSTISWPSATTPTPPADAPALAIEPVAVPLARRARAPRRPPAPSTNSRTPPAATSARPKKPARRSSKSTSASCRSRRRAIAMSARGRTRCDRELDRLRENEEQREAQAKPPRRPRRARRDRRRDQALPPGARPGRARARSRAGHAHRSRRAGRGVRAAAARGAAGARRAAGRSRAGRSRAATGRERARARDGDRAPARRGRADPARHCAVGAGRREDPIATVWRLASPRRTREAASARIAELEARAWKRLTPSSCGRVPMATGCGRTPRRSATSLLQCAPRSSSCRRPRPHPHRRCLAPTAPTPPAASCRGRPAEPERPPLDRRRPREERPAPASPLPVRRAQRAAPEHPFPNPLPTIRRTIRRVRPCRRPGVPAAREPGRTGRGPADRATAGRRWPSSRRSRRATPTTTSPSAAADGSPLGKYFAMLTLAMRSVLDHRSGPTELASQLRMAVMRLSRRLRQHAPEDITPSQLSALVGHRPRRRGSRCRSSPKPSACNRRRSRASSTRSSSRASSRAPCRPTTGASRSSSATADGRALVETIRRRRDAYLASPSRVRSRPTISRCSARAADAPRTSHRGSGAMTRVRRLGRATFSSLRNRNYRLYFTGQIISVSGTWMQRLAQAWLILSLTNNNGFALGIESGLQFLPMLLFGAWGGVHRRPLRQAPHALRHPGRGRTARARSRAHRVGGRRDGARSSTCSRCCSDSSTSSTTRPARPS